MEGGFEDERQSPYVVHLRRLAPSKTLRVSRVLIFPSPLRAPVRPHLSLFASLESLHCLPSKSTDHRTTPRLAGRRSLHFAASFPAPTRAPCHCPRLSHRAPVPCCPSRGLTALSSDALLAHLLRFLVSDPCHVLYLLGLLVCAPPRVVRLFLCVAFRYSAPCPECPFIC